MTDEKLTESLRIFYGTNYYPTSCFSADGKLVCSFSQFENGDATVFRVYEKSKEKKNFPCLIEDVLGLYGAVKAKIGGQIILIGPFINAGINDKTLEVAAKDFNLNAERKTELKRFLAELPRISYNCFLNIVAYQNFSVNGEVIDTGKQFALTTTENMEEIARKVANNIFREDTPEHNTYLFEQQQMSYVTAGDVEGLTAFFDNVMREKSFTEGKLADDELRQQKNILIGLICMVGKVGAINGNLDVEQVYRLIDVYTQKCEQCKTVDEVWKLRYNVVVDFTRRVAELKHPSALSNEVYSALQFIKTHTNLPICVPDVVRYVGKSRSAFLCQFKKETGQTVAKCISDAKLQESKQLLAYSDKSLSEIAAFFYFSSQSHFQNRFKEAFGITPMQYRKRKQR